MSNIVLFKKRPTDVQFLEGRIENIDNDLTLMKGSLQTTEIGR